MRRAIPVFLALALCLAVLALAGQAVSAQTLFESGSLDLELKIRNSFDALSVSGLQRASAELDWYPLEDYRQKPEIITTEPDSEFLEGKGFAFEWKRPQSSHFDIQLNSRISTKGAFLPVRKKIDFPITGLDSYYASYLEPREITDLNSEISSLASKIAEGQDDAFIVAVLLAGWVEKNVKYDLSTVTADASQKSSWVLENRKGVCDELTSLFISMARSVGIPARFVSGVSYSNVNLENDGWGPHGWAEIYLPEAGWVPFDVTYKQFGYVDATHLKLKVSPDAKETSVQYSIVSQKSEIKPGPLSFDVDIIRKGPQLGPFVSLDAKVSESSVGFGSYNLLLLQVKNPSSFYVTGRLYLANVSELSILGDNRVHYVLPPGGKKSFQWLIRTSENLKPGYVYTFPLSISGELGESALTSFRAEPRGSVYSEEYMRALVQAEEPSEKPYSKNLLISCASDKKEIYLGDRTSVSCSVSSTADRPLDLRVCFDRNCSIISLPAGGSKPFLYNVEFSSLGVKTIPFKADSGLASKTAYVIIPVVDEPLLGISNLTFDQSVAFDENSEIKFRISRESVSQPRNILIRLEHDLIQEEWPLRSLDNNYELRFLFKGENLGFGDNDFRLVVSYEDMEGKKYSVERKFTIELERLTLTQKGMLVLNILDAKLSKWLNSRLV